MKSKEYTFYLTFVISFDNKEVMKYVDAVKTDIKKVTEKMIDESRERVRNIFLGAYVISDDELGVSFSFASNAH